MTDVLSDAEVDRRLPDGWERDGDVVARTYEFDDYLNGVAFAADVAEVSEEAFHHPEITIGYKAVTVEFTTHEAGGITATDVEMAERCNDLL